tara:strand:- start:50 stop:388 length:339 start_codon:yes stop_codon:yes gene_type:complete
MNTNLKTQEYEIVSFDPKTTMMVWKLSNGNTISKVLEDDGFINYRGVNPYCHYVDTSNNTIVIINTPGNRIGIVENNILYTKASQFDYDTWMHNTKPDSDNAKVYRMLTNSE